MNDLIGQSIGRYEIRERLGEGGMAIVYKAHDTRLERDVAVKVIRTEKLTIETMGKTLKRFEREAKALAKLTHPNIVPITDYGEHGEIPYLVMSYLPGGTLKQRLGKPIPWEESVRLLIPVARALHYAHQQGIIHRDVKPSNILITQSGEPMLTDFGIAKILLDTEETADLTGTGMGVGTPEYMSPEQFLGKGVDARTDVYSLGVVLYEMITGRKPYQADTPAAVLIKQATEPLARPGSLIRNLPADMENLLLKNLAREKEGRFENTAEMARAMGNLIGYVKQNGVSAVIPDKTKKSFFRKSNNPSGNTLPPVAHHKSTEDILKTITDANSTNEELTTETQKTTSRFSAIKRGLGLLLKWILISGVITAIIIGIAKVIEIQKLSYLISSWDVVYSDAFNSNDGYWFTGSKDNDYYEGRLSLSDGKYIWYVNSAKQGFEGFVNFIGVVDGMSSSSLLFSDFYVSVEAKLISGPRSSCYGLKFRGNGQNYYRFKVCESQTYFVSLHTDEDGWKLLLAETSNKIKPNQINKLGVLAEGSKFYFYINDSFVDSVNDQRLSDGVVGIAIEMDEGDTGTFEFDNFIIRSP